MRYNKLKVFAKNYEISSHYLPDGTLSDILGDDMPLYWDATYAIVLRLAATYPDVDVDSVGTNQLLQMILDLPDFADEEALANEGLLMEILRVWYEEATLND